MNLPSAVLEKMLEKGLTLADVVEIAKVWEEGCALPLPALDRKRAYDRERMREKRRQENDMSHDSRTTNGDTKDVSPVPPSENPSPPKRTLKGPKKVPLPSTLPPEKPNAEPAKPLSWWVSEIWSKTPRPGRERSGRPSLENALRAAMRKGDDPARIAAGLAGYYASPDATKNHGEYAKGVHLMISSGRWEAFAEAQSEDPPPDDDPWPRRLLRWRTAQYWNSEWGPKPGRDGYLGPQTEARAA